MTIRIKLKCLSLLLPGSGPLPAFVISDSPFRHRAQ